jgi:hypothetical protein
MSTSERLPAKPLLSDTLSLLLPTEEQTWLLRACLHSGQAERQAWQAWLQRVGDPKQLLARRQQRIEWLLPLLYTALQRNGAEVDRAFLPYLRTAYFHEELRGQACRQICQTALTALTEDGIPALVLDGALLADTVYGDWALRHVHQLDILARAEDLARAVSALREAGFTPLADAGRAVTQSISLVHTTGFPADLQTGLFRIPYYAAPVAEMWARGLAREVAGVAVPTLAAAEMLLYVCGRALCSSRRDTLQWACDAWFIVKECSELDWDAFLRGVLSSRLALPLSVMLTYLSHALGVGLPAGVLHQLNAAAAQTSIVGHEAALSGARLGSRGTLRNLLSSAGSCQARAAVLKWMLLPSPSCLRWTYGIRSPWLLLPYYAYRPLGYFARRILGGLDRGTPRARR